MADATLPGPLLDRLETLAVGLCGIADMLGGLKTLEGIPPQRLAMLLSLLTQPLLEALQGATGDG